MNFQSMIRHLCFRNRLLERRVYYSTFRMIESCVEQMASSTNKPLNFSIEGNIGSGKSTVLAHLGKSPLCEIIAEPLEDWTNINGNNLLEMLYNDPRRWGFTFQANAQMTLAKLHAQPAKRPVKIMERSIYSSKYCFVENLYRNNILQNVEYEILKGWFELLTSSHSCHLDLIIYLRAKPEICLERIKSRNRPGEQAITLDYLQQLHERHEQWLASQTSPFKIPVLIVDGNQTKEYVYSETDTQILSRASS